MKDKEQTKYNVLYDSPAETANFFLKKAFEEDYPITPLFLMQIMYFGYAWVLAIEEKKLFSEPFEAWKHGPVIPSLYHEFKSYGNQVIDRFSQEMEFPTLNADDEVEQEVVYKTPKVDEGGYSTKFLQKVWGIYKRFTTRSLVTLSHEKGGPWYKAQKLGYNTKIDDDEIKTFFTNELEKLFKAQENEEKP